MTGVLIVEDSRIMRRSLEQMLDESSAYEVVASIENAANAEIACMSGRIDLVLMDVCTAEDESGLRAAAKIKAANSRIRVIIMTSMPEHSFIRKAWDAGCDGFWYKELDEMSILDVMDRTLAGEKIYPRESPLIRIGLADSTMFTERELEVLRMLVQGCKYEEVATRLSISINTVKFHVRNLLAKTGYSNTLQMIVDVVDKKLILPKY